MTTFRTVLRVSIILSCCLCQLQSVAGEIVGAFVLPHGGIALDPSHFHPSNSTAKKLANEIHQACNHIGSQIVQLNADTVFLSTPHGISDMTSFVFYSNPTAFGTAETDNCSCPPCCYNVSVNTDTDLTQHLVNKLKYVHKVSTLTSFGEPWHSEEAFPLKWGEVIPLTFLVSAGFEGDVSILSQPSSRYKTPDHQITKLLNLGYDLFDILEESIKRVVVVVSADLAHTHSEDGPYGYSNTSEPFDKACADWVRTLDSSYLLLKAAEYVDTALSCGYTGLVMLQGILEAAGSNQWQSHLLAIGHPSYYGMMAASFYRT